MKPIEYLKLQAKNLYRDFKTQKPYYDADYGDQFYDYEPRYFDMNAILIGFDIDQDNFTLMNAQHIIARLVGFGKWTELLKASVEAQELSKLLFDNMHKICIEEWGDYLARTEHENKVEFHDETKLEIFKKMFSEVEGHESFKMNFRLTKNENPTDETPKKSKPKRRKSSVKITELPLIGATRKKFIKTAKAVFEYLVETIEPQHPDLVRELWDAEKYIDKMLLRSDMLPIELDYALSFIDAFLFHHVIALVVETEDQDPI